MDGPTISALVTALGVLGGGVTWLIRRRDKKKDPLPKSAAELAIAQQALDIISDAATFSRKDSENLRARVVQLELDSATDRIRIGRLETLLSHAASYIEALLRWAHGLRSVPRPPALPPELHDLVDPALWITNAAPQEPDSSPNA